MLLEGNQYFYRPLSLAGRYATLINQFRDIYSADIGYQLLFELMPDLRNIKFIPLLFKKTDRHIYYNSCNNQP
ncbi:hypothetical protein Xekj_02853 [Xenorhabdus sp. KJ12.1]|nr:hypothetical protein Xekj_02853 [Xenorhabdus sp. KJ12.1]